MTKEIIFWGAKGQAKVLREILKNTKFKLVALFDNDQECKSPFHDVPLYYGKDGFERWLSQRSSKKNISFFVAIGRSGKERLSVHEYLKSKELVPVILKHKSAVIADDVLIGEGSQIHASTTLDVETSIGKGCVINIGAVIGHEVVIGDGCFIGANATICGEVRIEKYSTIYTSVSILPRVTIGEGAIVAAGSIVKKDVSPYTLVSGNPAKIKKQIK